MKALLLYPGHEYALSIYFRDLSGLDEMDICQQSGPDSELITHLLRRLVTHIEQAGLALEYNDLTLTAQDQCLAHFYMSHYGQNVPCQVSCRACESGYEFTFDLAAFKDALEKQAQTYGPDSDNIFSSKDSGRQFRLPTISDLERLREEDPKDWLKSFLVSGPFDYDAFQKEMDTAGPLFSQDIEAACPECEKSNPIRFDLANYCLQALRSEQPFLAREIHLIARKYGWNLSEILELSRDLRRQFAALITADATALRRAS